MENELTILKVARGHILKKLAPAVALATGLAGCATDLPTVGKSPVVNVSRLTQDLETLMQIAPDRLDELIKNAQELNFTDSEDVKKKGTSTSLIFVPESMIQFRLNTISSLTPINVDSRPRS